MVIPKHPESKDEAGPQHSKFIRQATISKICSCNFVGCRGNPTLNLPSCVPVLGDTKQCKRRRSNAI